MPGLLGPTNPVPGYDPQPVRVTVPPPTDTTVQNIVDPERVVRPDRRTDREDTGDSTGAARYESNYMTFLQRLRGTQTLPETFQRVLQWGGAEIASGIREGFAGELARFMEFLRMDEGELLNFLQNQMRSSSRFTGALFALLRDAYAGARSELAQTEILNFLRRYSDFSSTEHLEGKILRETEEMSASMPSQWGDQIGEILAKLRNGVAAGDRQGNLRLLRGQLFPLVSRYVSTTHDHGRARSMLSLLTLDVARYENGSEEGLVRSFRRLTAAGVLPKEMETLSDADIPRLLRDADFSKASRNNAFADRMGEVMNQALQGKGGASVQEAFHHIMTAILINESVYMPLNHVMLPLDWNGNHMFSEIWVDPDAEKQSDGGGGGDGERVMRILLKLDIESLGAFDLLINARGENISMSAAVPRDVALFSGTVSQALTTILTRNGLHVDSLDVAEMKRPVTVTEAFPKLFRSMSGINIKV